MYRITLRSVGNPDFGQDPYQPMSPAEEITVDTLQQAAEAARAYIVRHDLGGGNFPSPHVFKGNQVVARISYNGQRQLAKPVTEGPRDFLRGQSPGGRSPPRHSLVVNASPSTWRFTTAPP